MSTNIILPLVLSNEDMTIITTSLPLGRAIPEGLHAISVQVPTWSDMCGMGRGDLQIMDALQNGHPRTFIRKDIKEVGR
jgi:cystathionine gamma-synthase